MFCCCCLNNDHSERLLQKTFKCKACGYVVDESRVNEHRQTCSKIAEFTGKDLFEEQIDVIPELISPKNNRNTKFYQCQKCTYALPANLKDIHVSLCSNLYETNQEQFKDLSKQEYDAITTDYIKCGFCNKFIRQYELNEHSKVCPIYIAKKPFQKYSYGDYFELFVEDELKKKNNSRVSINSNNQQNDMNNNNKQPIEKPKNLRPIKINAVITTSTTSAIDNNNNNFKKFTLAENKLSSSPPMKSQQQSQPLLHQNNNNNISIDNTVKSSSLLMASSTKPIIISSTPPLPSSSNNNNNNNNKLRSRTNSECPTSKTISPAPAPHRHSMGTFDTGFDKNSPVEIARTRARTSLSRGYDVRKHCRGISKSHNTVILLSENELVWKSKGGNEFSSIGLDAISKVLCNKNRVTIKSSERDLVIDIENESDRNEFVTSLRTLITPIK